MTRLLASLAVVALLSLTGCSADGLTGPDMQEELRAPQTTTVMQDVPHNDLSRRGGDGRGTATKAPAEHNELPDSD